VGKIDKKQSKECVFVNSALKIQCHISAILPTGYNVLVLSDYSKGFGGKYGVQTDRKDAVRILNTFVFDVQASLKLQILKTSYRQGFKSNKKTTERLSKRQNPTFISLTKLEKTCSHSGVAK